MNKKYRLSPEEVQFISNLRGGEETVSRPRLSPKEYEKLKSYREGKKSASSTINAKELKRLQEKEKEADAIIENLKMDGNIEIREINVSSKKENRTTVPIVQLSDWHIDENVNSKTVLGLNEYNPKVAQKRADLLFHKMCKLIEHHQTNYDINEMILALQGDFIGGWIHDELMQTNSESPLNAIRTARNMILSGLKYMHDNLDMETIHVVCVSGNHSRTSRRIQFSNFSDVSLEYGMYKDLEELCSQIGLHKFRFIVPSAEMTVIEMMGKKMLFAHGHEFKYAGGVGGIYPSMLRWFNKIANVFKLDIAFIGHWHQSIFTPQCIVNNSLKGYDAYAMGKGLDFQPPSQNLTLLDSKYGFCLHQEIFPF